MELIKIKICYECLFDQECFQNRIKYDKCIKQNKRFFVPKRPKPKFILKGK